ncbi:hypothetical protein ACWC98_31935 [Streptomyces goshikiensis]
MTFQSASSPEVEVRLTEILWYGRIVDSLDEAHTGKVLLIGCGAARISPDDVLIAVGSRETDTTSRE